MKKKAVILLSGGLDSTTVLYHAKSKGYKCQALIFDYGQKHKKEITCAKRLARLNKCPHYVIKFSLPWKGSSLTDKNIGIPRHKIIGEKIPSTYVPARNTVLLSFAVSLAETINAETVFIGANSIDFSGYPDCRPEYFRIFNKIIAAGTKKGAEGKNIRIIAPFLYKSKSSIIRTGRKLKVPYKITWSCYKGGEKPCMECDSCRLRAEGFKKAGIPDPLLPGNHNLG